MPSISFGFPVLKTIERTYRKIEHTCALIDKIGSKGRIGVDGGVDLSFALKALQMLWFLKNTSCFHSILFERFLSGNNVSYRLDCIILPENKSLT